MEECNANKEKMLKELMSLDFSINDFSLYLDTHPNDAKALQKHCEYTTKYNKLKEEYQKNYGPLTIYFNSNDNTWEWIDEPWPWERGAY